MRLLFAKLFENAIFLRLLFRFSIILSAFIFILDLMNSPGFFLLLVQKSYAFFVNLKGAHNEILKVFLSSLSLVFHFPNIYKLFCLFYFSCLKFHFRVILVISYIVFFFIIYLCHTTPSSKCLTSPTPVMTS